MKTLSSKNFDAEIAASAVPLLVKCGAPWCAECAALDALLASLLPRWKERLAVAKIDVSVEETLRVRLRVIALPALFLYKNGAVVWKGVGVVSRRELIAVLEKECG
jgi:thioredoxin 1